VLVFGSVHIGAEFIGGGPKDSFEFVGVGRGLLWRNGYSGLEANNGQKIKVFTKAGEKMPECPQASGAENPVAKYAPEPYNILPEQVTALPARIIL